MKAKAILAPADNDACVCSTDLLDVFLSQKDKDDKDMGTWDDLMGTWDDRFSLQYGN